SSPPRTAPGPWTRGSGSAPHSHVTRSSDSCAERGQAAVSSISAAVPMTRAIPWRSAARGARVNRKNGMNGMSGIRRRARRLGRWLGVDRNPLRRRTDKIATWLMAQFLVAVLIGAPLFGIAAFTWAGRAGAAEQRAERSWHEVPAVLLRS